MDEHNFGYAVEHQAYPDAGHLISRVRDDDVTRRGGTKRATGGPIGAFGLRAESPIPSAVVFCFDLLQTSQALVDVFEVVENLLIRRVER